MSTPRTSVLCSRLRIASAEPVSVKAFIMRMHSLCRTSGTRGYLMIQCLI